jgi:predicted dehydrogenase
MSVRTLKWGLLSTAHINRALIFPIRQSPRSDLVAVASRDLDKARSYAKEWKIPKFYGSYESLLEDPDINIVYISLPNRLHAEWTIKALQAGKHVLCEKPLAISLEQVDAIIAAARQTGRIAVEAFMYRHHPQTLRLKEMADQGSLGEICLVRGAFSYTISRPDNVRLVADLGGGSIWDVGCYPINYARFILGTEPVEAFGWARWGITGIDDTFTGQLLFPGDRILQFDSSFRLPSRSFMEFVGSKGAVRLDTPYKPGEKAEIHITRSGEMERISVRGQELYIGEVNDLEDAILDHKPPRVSLEDSRGNVAAILALIESARIGKPVNLNQINP